MGRVFVSVHTGVPGLARLHCTDFASRFKATFNRVHSVFVRFFQRLSRRNAAWNRRYAGRKKAVFVLKIINVELLMRFHAGDDIDTEVSRQTKLNRKKTGTEAGSQLTGCARAAFSRINPQPLKPPRPQAISMIDSK